MMLQLLETVPQDIKSARDYKPCAPEFFRWVMVGIYLSVLLGAAVWGLFLLREKQQTVLAATDQKKLTEIQQKIAEVKAQGAQSEQLRQRYENWQGWLKGNYALSRFLAQLYKALPEGTRLQELTLKEAPGRPGSFALKMRFFAKGANKVPDTQEFEDKLAALGAELQDRQQSVSENGRMEIEATVVLPRNFYPNGGSMPMMTSGPASAMSAPVVTTPIVAPASAQRPAPPAQLPVNGKGGQ